MRKKRGSLKSQLTQGPLFRGSAHSFMCPAAACRIYLFKKFFAHKSRTSPKCPAGHLSHCPFQSPLEPPVIALIQVKQLKMNKIVAIIRWCYAFEIAI